MEYRMLGRSGTAVSAAHGTTAGQVALAWVAARPGVSSALLGARTAAQMEENLAESRLRLDSAETAKLDTASDPRPAEYPYGLSGSFQRQRWLEPSPIHV